jgi:UrcA family protein
MKLVTKAICLNVAFIATLLQQVDAAEPPGLVPQTVVNYSDLNLNSPAGAATLYARIARAADLVCPAGGHEALLNQAARAGCKANAIRRAVEDVRAPELTRYYASKVGPSIDSSATLAASGK